MAVRLSNPKIQYFDKNTGAVLSGGEMYFFDTNTSTPKDTFSDAEGTIPNTNPVILDNNGRTPDIFGIGSYRIQLRAKPISSVLLGAVQFDEDPVIFQDDIGANSQWSAITTYNINDITKGSDNFWYTSLQNGNINNDPLVSPSFWTRFDYVKRWNSQENYLVDDLVRSTTTGILYTAVQASLNQNPDSDTTSSFWRMLGNIRIQDNQIYATNTDGALSIFSDGNGQVSISASGTGAILIDQTGTGNVTINSGAALNATATTDASITAVNASITATGDTGITLTSSAGMGGLTVETGSNDIALNTTGDITKGSDFVSIALVPTLQIFSTPGMGTYTPTAGARYCKVEGVGGGGGGGSPNSPGPAAAGGGGAGGYFLAYIDLTGVTSIDYNIGAGGAGGAASSNTGATGGNTTFSPASGVITANGGTGGNFTESKGIGGSATVTAGQTSIDGQDGSSGGTPLGSNQVLGGSGGNSVLGYGGVIDRVFLASSVPGENAKGPGGGGSGGANSSIAGVAAGGDGGDGQIRITEYY